MKFDYDVLVVGGGPAGISSAMTLGRMSRTVLICDDDRPRNAPSSHLNNFPTRDGIHPAQWREAARKDLEKYQTVQFTRETVLSVERQPASFEVQLSAGKSVLVRKLILTDGVQDRLPPIPGLKELWGKSVLHCVFCHGYEVRKKRLGLIANGAFALHILPLVRNLSSDLILFTNGKADLTPDFQNQIKKKGIELVETPIEQLIHDGEELKTVVLSNGEKLDRDALFVIPVLPFQTKSSLGEKLGCEKTEMGFLKVGDRNETSVKGVFAGGDNMTMMHSVSNAVSSGNIAGAGAFFALANEDFENL